MHKDECINLNNFMNSRRPLFQLHKLTLNAVSRNNRLFEIIYIFNCQLHQIGLSFEFNINLTLPIYYSPLTGNETHAVI